MSQYEKEESSDRYSLRGKVFHQLREDILSGHYKEHEELREMAISEEMGVSRTSGKRCASWNWKVWSALSQTRGHM